MGRREVLCVSGAVLLLFVVARVSFFPLKKAPLLPSDAIERGSGYGVNELRRRVRSHRTELQKLTERVIDVNGKMRSSIARDFAEKNARVEAGPTIRPIAK